LGNDARFASDVGAFAASVAGATRIFAPDVIMGPGNSYVAVLHRVIAQMGHECPAVVCKISNPLFRDARSRIGQFLFVHRFRYLTREFDGLAAMSPALRTEAQHLLRRRDVVSLAEPNLDTRALPTRADTPPNHILCVGRLSAQKNFALALETFALLGKAYRITILGEGEQYRALVALAARLGIADRVHFAGFVEDVSAHLTQASVLLSTSRFEGFPAALVEAVAAGVPIVTTPCSMALPDILLDPTFGLVVPPEDVLLARAIHVVCSQKHMPNSELLAKFVEQHQLGRSAELWLDWMDEVVVKQEHRHDTA
jgi:glycosyltransferase involved in cell wall biosynthesis